MVVQARVDHSQGRVQPVPGRQILLCRPSARNDGDAHAARDGRPVVRLQLPQGEPCRRRETLRWQGRVQRLLHSWSPDGSPGLYQAVSRFRSQWDLKMPGLFVPLLPPIVILALFSSPLRPDPTYVRLPPHELSIRPTPSCLFVSLLTPHPSSFSKRAAGGFLFFSSFGCICIMRQDSPRVPPFLFLCPFFFYYFFSNPRPK